MTKESAKKEVKDIQVAAKTPWSVFKKAVVLGIMIVGSAISENAVGAGADHQWTPEDSTVKVKPAAANDTAISAAKAALEIGDKMADGTIYAGISPDTKRPMYAAPADAPRNMTFNKAEKYAKNLEVGGKKGFRVPTKAELDVLFQNREKGALKGTFNLTGLDPDGYYWSSTPGSDISAWAQRFSDGDQNGDDRYDDSSVRCVTEENAKKSIQVNIEEGVNAITINGTKVEISPEGNVVVYTNNGESVQTKPALATKAAAKEGASIDIDKDFNTVAMYGAKVELTIEGSLIVYTNGTVKVKPAAANGVLAFLLRH